jgi:hypothetical protein
MSKQLAWLTKHNTSVGEHVCVGPIHPSYQSVLGSLSPWMSCHVTLGSRVATYVTPQPLWRGLVVIVIVPTYATRPQCEGDWHRSGVVFNCVVSPPTWWTGLCGAPTITLYCPQQQPVRTCWSPHLGMAAHLRFQGLPLPASRCV